LYGAWSVSRPAAGAALVLIGAPLHLAREIAKDLDDAAADAAARRTVPVRFGATAARRVLAAATIAFVFLFASLLVTVPGRRAARAAPFALAAVAAIFLTAAAARAAWSGRPGGPRLFKAAMLCAMAAVATSRL
jgi:1,4-dihydroxy-2-naphthoate octaprenyltransferase